MRVRVYDRDRGGCFQSELYALVAAGIFERCLVVQDGLLRFFPRLAETGPGHYETVTSFIDPALPSQWLRLSNDDIRNWLDFPRVSGRSPAFQGYPWVWEDRRTLQRLLRGEPVPLAETGYPAVSSLLPGWRYVTDPAAAEAFLAETGNLHDAVLVRAGYTSGSGKCSGGMAVCDRVRQVSLLFHCGWTPPAELVFEGVKAFHLYPGGNNCVSALSEAVCRVSNAAVFFCVDYCEEGEDPSGRTNIWAYSMRWRFLDETSESDPPCKLIF